jgi:hypothetical protein
MTVMTATVHTAFYRRLPGSIACLLEQQAIHIGPKGKMVTRLTLCHLGYNPCFRTPTPGNPELIKPLADKGGSCHLLPA